MTTLQDIEWLDPLVESQRNLEIERYVKQKAGLAPPTRGSSGPAPGSCVAVKKLEGER